MIWKFITFFVRRLDPEIAHKITIKFFKLGLHPRLNKIGIPINIGNLIFKNFIGVAAGFDKNAEVINKIHFLNFGFTEVGTITPMPQYGNPKPRIFRLEKDRAIINRNGFNNLGMLQASKKLGDYRKKFPIGSSFLVGINIGPNKDSEDRFSDYKVLAKNLSKFADYISINVSSPNTPNLREFQNKENLEKVINFVKDGIATSKTFNKKLPIFLKIAPDINYQTLKSIIETAHSQKIFGLIISNTTLDRERNLKSKKSKELGGLSGKPLFKKSTDILSQANKIIKNNNYKLFLIAAGGVSDSKTAYVKILCGAHLVQLYSSLTFEGPLVANQIISGILKLMKRDKIENIIDIVGVIDNPKEAMSVAINGFKNYKS
jgi:dihydroorotate dehydrogenase